jgi:PAS domain-containing protein
MEGNLSELPVLTGAGSDDMAMHEDIIRRNCRMTEVNEAMLAIRSRDREEVIGHPCYETSQSYDEPCGTQGEARVLRDVFETGQPRSCCHQHARTDGSKVWVDLLFSPLKDKKGGVR